MSHTCTCYIRLAVTSITFFFVADYEVWFIWNKQKQCANATYGPSPVQRMFRDRTEAILDRWGPGPGPILTLVIHQALTLMMRPVITEIIRIWSHCYYLHKACAIASVFVWARMVTQKLLIGDGILVRVSVRVVKAIDKEDFQYCISKVTFFRICECLSASAMCRMPLYTMWFALQLGVFLWCCWQ